MKKRMSVLIVMMMILALFAAVPSAGETARAAESDFVVDASGVLTAYNGLSSATVINIPENLGITRIGDYVFDGLAALKTVTIPEGVTEIGRGAFDGCSSLAALAFPSTVKSVEAYAFRNCDALTSLTLNEGLETIGTEAFGYLDSLTSVSIPSSVTSLGNNAFISCPKLRALTLNEGLEAIGNYAFSQSVITKAVIPSTVKSIGDYAFYCCYNLASLTLNEGLETIGEGAFWGINISSLTLPSTVKTLADMAFHNTYMSSIKLNEGLETIGSGAFSLNTSLKTVTIPSTVRSLNGFSNCTNLETVTVLGEVQTIGDSAFSGCSKLYGINIPSGCTNIGKYAFNNCAALTTLTLSENIETIGEKAFNGCAGLKVNVIEGSAAYDYCVKNSIAMNVTPTAPEILSVSYRSAYRSDGTMVATFTVETETKAGQLNLYDAQGTLLHSYEADDCDYEDEDSVRTWTISRQFAQEGTQVIRFEAISGAGLTSEIYECSVEVTCCQVLSASFEAAEIMQGSTACAVVTTTQGVDTLAMLSGSKLLASWDADTCSAVSDGVRVWNVSHIFDQAGEYSLSFMAKNAVNGYYTTAAAADLTVKSPFVVANGVLTGYLGTDTVIVIPDDLGITEIGSSVFYGCETMTSVSIPEGVKKIGNAAFQGPNSLTSVTIPEGVEEIGAYAFSECSDLTEISLPASLKTIGSYAFAYSDNLKEIRIPAGVTAISDYAFADCYALKSVSMAGNVETIGRNAFDHCVSLETVEIPDSVTTIGSYAFYCCNALKSVRLPAALTTVSGEGAFHNCTALETVEIPDGVKLIGVCMFTGCTSLDSISLPSSVTHIGALAFQGCPLETIEIPSGVKRIGVAAFGYSSVLKTVRLSEGLETIDTEVFTDCPALESINIPASVTSIGDGAIRRSKNLLVTVVKDTLGHSYCIENDILFTGEGIVPHAEEESFALVQDADGSVHADFVIRSDSAAGSVRLYASGSEPVHTVGEYTDDPSLWAVDRRTWTFSYMLPDETVVGDEISFDVVSSLGTATERKVHTVDAAPAKVLSADVPLDEVEAYVIVEINAETTPGADNLYMLRDDTVLAVWDADTYSVVEDGRRVWKVPYAFRDTGANKLTFACVLANGNYSTTKVLDSVYVMESDFVVEDGVLTEYTGNAFDLVIPDNMGISQIAGMVFADNIYLETVVVPNGVTTIGYGAFWNCKYLETVSLPESVVMMDSSVFNGCSGLTEIDLPSGLTEIDSNMFRSCSRLTKVGMPSGLTGIGSYAFNGCSKLTEIDIPSGVTSIGYGAFSGCSSLKDVVLPVGLKEVDDSLFNGCSSLTEMDIPSGVASIGERAFSGCGALTGLTLPEKLREIGAYAFEGCYALEQINIPDSVVRIFKYTFLNCSSLQKIELPAHVRSIEDGAFDGCTALESVNIPEKTSDIGTDVFAGCSSLVVEVVKDSYAHTYCVENAIFHDGEGIEPAILSFEAPLGMYEDGSTFATFIVRSDFAADSLALFDEEGNLLNTFDGRSEYRYTENGSCVWAHAVYCFEKEGVQRISLAPVTKSGTVGERHEFELDVKFCKVLSAQAGVEQENTCVQVPFTVETTLGAEKLQMGEWETYGFNAMASWDAETYSVVKDGKRIWNISRAWECSDETRDLELDFRAGWMDSDGEYRWSTARAEASVTILKSDFWVKHGVLSSYTGADTDVVIPDNMGITAIGAYAFDDCDALTAVSIPEGVTTIGEYAFAYCDALTAVSLPEGVTTIGNSVFRNCDALTAVSLPEGVTAIGDAAFYDCDALTEISLPEGVTTIGASAFAYCDVLTEISLPEGVTTIGNSAFRDCDALTAVSLPEGVTAIGTSAFYDCDALTAVSLPEGVTTIGGFAFYDCNALTEISLPEGVTTIGEYAFYSCNALTEISLPEGVTTIGGFAFYDCNALTAVSLPEGVTTIGDAAFYDCNALTEISLPEGVTTIGEYAFYSCDALTEISLPESVTAIGAHAFAGSHEMTAYVYSGSCAEQYCIDYGLKYELLSKPVVNSAEAAQTVQADGSAMVTFTVKTNPAVKKLYMTLENGTPFRTLTNGYADANGVRTWTIRQAFSVDGTRCIGFTAENAVGDQSERLEISPVIKCARVTAAAFSPANVLAGTAAKATVKTSAGATHLALFTETDAKIRIYDAATYSTVSGSVRTWNVDYTFNGVGRRTLTFKASADGVSYSSTAKTAALNVLKPASVVSAASRQTVQADGSAKLTFTVVTDTAAAKLKVYAGAALIRTADSGYSDKDGLRTWTVSQVFTVDGTRDVSFAAVAANGNESSKLTIRPVVSCAKVLAAEFNPATVPAGSEAKAVVKTSSGATHLALYTETDAKIRTYDAATYSTVSGSTRTWNVSYTFNGMGERSLTFRASAGGSSFSTASKTAKLTVRMADAKVNSAEYGQTVQADGAAKVTFTVKTSTNTAKVKVYAENSLIRTASSGYTDAAGVRTWKIEQSFNVDGERTISFSGVNAEGTESAKLTIRPTIKCAKVTSAAFSPATVTAGSEAKAVVKTSSGATHLALYTETDAKIRTYDAATYSTVSGSTRTWNVSYTFNGTGERSLTFRASAGGSSFSTASKTAKLTVTK